MRTLLCLALLTAATVRGEEPPPGAGVRQKLHVRILESAPPPPPAPEKSETEKKAEADAVPAVLLMKPVVVTEVKAARYYSAWIERRQHKLEAERFSPISGGTLYSKEFGGKKLELGGWWTPQDGWSFLKLSW